MVVIQNLIGVERGDTGFSPALEHVFRFTFMAPQANINFDY